jgi:uncharacterized protein (DUF302 family)
MSGYSVNRHEVNRLTISVDAGYDDFRRRYQEAAPTITNQQLGEFVRGGGNWPGMVDWVDQIAPHGFLIYAAIETDGMMQLAGHAARGTEYLMGNHTIAERMFRHDPAIMMHAPLRTYLWEHADQSVRFAVDQPSSQFASYGQPEIAEVGVELDRKLAALLEYLDAPVPKELLASGA